MIGHEMIDKQIEESARHRVSAHVSNKLREAFDLVGELSGSGMNPADTDLMETALEKIRKAAREHLLPLEIEKITHAVVESALKGLG